MPRLLFPLFLVLLAGCGQKGPLFLPTQAPATPAAAPAPAEAPDTSPSGADGSAGEGQQSESRERAVPAPQP